MGRRHKAERSMSPWLHGMRMRERNSQLGRFASLGFILVMCMLTGLWEDSELCRVY